MHRRPIAITSVLATLGLLFSLAGSASAAPAGSQQELIGGTFQNTCTGEWIEFSDVPAWFAFDPTTGRTIGLAQGVAIGSSGTDYRFLLRSSQRGFLENSRVNVATVTMVLSAPGRTFTYHDVTHLILSSNGETVTIKPNAPRFTPCNQA